MRSLAEIHFRLRQELANVALWLFPGSLSDTVDAPSPLPSLPDPNVVAGQLKGTPWAAEVRHTADKILNGYIPLLGNDVHIGTEPAWRRDWKNGRETDVRFFRRIPYLDANIAGDHKNIWELSRHQYLVLVAQAYLLTGDPRYRDFVFRQLRHWWAENPFQRGINWTSALEVAFRALSWIWIWHLLGSEMDAGFRRQFLRTLWFHALHLEYNLSVYFSPNTHLLGEAVALHAIYKLFPSLPNAAAKKELARNVVARELSVQVRPDGGYFEQSTYYHVYAVDMFVFHHLLEPLPEEPLRRMAEFLASIVGPDGKLPFLGDDDGGRFFHPFGARTEFARGTLATCSTLFGIKYLPTLTDTDFFDQAVWWRGPAVLQNEPSLGFPAESRSFAQTGLVSLRHADLRLLFDAGPFGPWGGGHSHSDTLGFVLQIGERELLIDPGTYTYVGDPADRDRFRGSAAHNTIRVDGRDQAQPAGPFRWLEKPATELTSSVFSETQDVVEGACSYNGIRHRRRITLYKAAGCIRVEDSIEGDGEHDIEQFWHLGDGVGLGQWLQLDPALTVTTEAGWRSEVLGTLRESGPVVTGRLRCSLPIRLETNIRCYTSL